MIRYILLLAESAVVLLLPFALICLPIYAAVNKFNKSEYAMQTHNSYFKTRFDKGRYGEYASYKYLRMVDGCRKFIFNCYVPKDDGTTTEIDMIMIHNSGVFVFESKNYSGWIYGSESQRQWTQTLAAGRRGIEKNRFYNPIMQNKSHIKWLKQLLEKDIPYIDYHSVIVFSKRCQLKKITLESTDIPVINRNHIYRTVEPITKARSGNLSDEEVEQIYKKLLPLSQMSEEAKAEHIKNINNNNRGK